MDNWAGPVDRWSGEDRFTALWTEMVEAFRDGTPDCPNMYFAGLLKAYCLVTGDIEVNVRHQVERAATELLAS